MATPQFPVALAFGVGGVAAAAVIFYGVNDTVIDEEETITRAVAPAEVRDLVEFNDLSGRMVYADVKPIVSSEDGVITDVLHSGDTIERGTVLYALNDSPTAVSMAHFRSTGSSVRERGGRRHRAEEESVCAWIPQFRRRRRDND